MRRFLLRIIQVLLIASGFGLILYAGYSYIGPDLVFAIEQVVPGSEAITAVPAISSPTAAAQAAPAVKKPTVALPPYPRGQGQQAMRLVIPHMHLDTSIKEATWTTSSQHGTLYSDWVLPYDAAGHLINTARPGEAGNMVISGHNNLVGPNQFGVGLFAGLWNLKSGDPIYVEDALGRAFEYRVTQSYSLKEEGQPMAVREQHARTILADNGQPTATLITCWNGPVAPLSGNTYRWVVKADFMGQVDPGQLPAHS